MDNRIIYISYATLDTPYKSVIEKYLLPSLQRFNLSYDIVYPENRGSWQANTRIKAEIIKEMLLKHKCPVVSLDADATIHSYPALFDTLQDYDLGIHYLDKEAFWGKGKTGIEALSGTLYLNYNERVLKLIDEWILENKNSDFLEQRNLQNVLAKNKDLKIYTLPIQYVAIVGSNNQVPNFIKNPIIVHHQCSRLYKKRMFYNKGKECI